MPLCEVYLDCPSSPTIYGYYSEGVLDVLAKWQFPLEPLTSELRRQSGSRFQCKLEHVEQPVRECGICGLFLSLSFQNWTVIVRQHVCDTFVLFGKSSEFW